MKLFCVFQEGNYRHECHGIFDNESAALQCANTVAADDKDSHHVYTVVPFTLNKRIQTEKDSWSSPHAVEEKAIYSTNKSKQTTRP